MTHSYRKFLKLQHSIDVALIELQHGKRENVVVSVGAMPSIEGGYYHNELGIVLGTMVALFLIVILVVTFIVPLVEEKEDGLKVGQTSFLHQFNSILLNYCIFLSFPFCLFNIQLKEFLVISTPLAYLNGLAFYVVHYIMYMLYGSLIITLAIAYQCLGIVPIFHGIILYVLFLTAMMSYSYLISVCFQKGYSSNSSINRFSLLLSAYAIYIYLKIMLLHLSIISISPSF